MSSVTVREDTFGNYSGSAVRRFTLTNCRSMSVSIITYGATITSIQVPDNQGQLDDVVLGFDSLKEYYSNNYYFGSTIGRFANRIAGGKFSLGGKEFSLCRNNGPNHLHGGLKGYDKVLWQAQVLADGVTLSHQDEAHEGYPGTVNCQVTFRLTDENELIIAYRATSSEATPISLTNHSYFNLAGHQKLEPIDDHLIELNADAYTPVDDNGIPLGEIVLVKGTNFDLRQLGKLGARFASLPRGGYDNNFCIEGKGKKTVAKLVDPPSGRVLDVWSTLPGVQIYTANFLPTDDSLKGKGQQIYRRHEAVCFETQHYPNAVNQPNFPSCILNPGEVFDEVTVYKFSTLG